MKHAYQLDSKNEAKRLEEQSANKNYSLAHELTSAQVEMASGEKVLDAGCGTGLLSRFLIDFYADKRFNIEAIDITENLIRYAIQESTHSQKYQERIHFQKKSITDLDEGMKFDKIFSRFVFQHIPSREIQKQSALALWNSLNSGGKMYLIDCFGFFSHLDSSNAWLVEQIQNVEKAIPIDMNVGIKLRGILLDIGVPSNCIHIQTLPFNFNTQEEREAEASLWRQRFENAAPLLTSTLGEVMAQKFKTEYLREFLNPRTYIYAQKFILTITKP